MAQYQIPGGGVVDDPEFGTQYQIPGYGFLAPAAELAPGLNAPTRLSRGFNLQQMADAEDEGRFNELDVRNWWCEAFA